MKKIFIILALTISYTMKEQDEKMKEQEKKINRLEKILLKLNENYED